MKIVMLPGNVSLNLKRPLELQLEHADGVVLGDALHFGGERAVPAAGDVVDPFEELVVLDAARELLVAQEPVVVAVDLSGR
jgi:hypothetical protein